MRAANAANLPFADVRDFEEAARGFIAAPSYTQIMADAGHVAWDMGRYQFLLEGEDYGSIHPSTQRMAVLNMSYGLYEVIPRIYQVRGFDLSNITFIQGETGWIVFDPLYSREPARAALELVNEHLGQRPVVAVVYSHSHLDHFGGVRGIVDEADVRAGRVQIIAPTGFMEHAIAEGVYAGNAMTRRAQLQYAQLLPASPYGHVDQSIGKNTSTGAIGLIAPTRIIEDAIEKLTVDGVTMVFQNTPGAEAPAEMNTYFPEFKALWPAENVTGTIHNIYTLRGAKVRDALLWSKYINETLYEFGLEAEVMFASHSWPRWGNDRVQEVLRAQRDAYAHLNNQALHLANQGVSSSQIHNVYEVPQSLQQQWAARSYHGAVENNVRAVLNFYLGFWDTNPVNLIPLSPEESAPLYVEMMGGRGPILAKGRELYDRGEYLQAQEIVDKLVWAQPDDEEAKDLLADIFEQLGYQQESNSLRNSFLAAAFELRSGVPDGEISSPVVPDVLKAMTTEMFLDFLAIRMDSRAAEAAGLEFTINFVTPDRGEMFVLELSNATLTNIAGHLAEDADLTVTIARGDLDEMMTGETTWDALVAEQKVTLEGDIDVLRQLMATMVTFTPDFEMLPGTKR
ncbi:MAG: MBL fold metallo-hydrolase [Gemmatimonadetes bacterium]|nr:MBL fold metallo-hydrolase [Gemmatimonadota bacterium]